MAKKAQAIPKGYHTVTPNLIVAGAVRAIDFYKQAFGAAEIRIGDSVIMLADEMVEQNARGPKAIGATSVGFFIYGDNVDASWKRALDAGATAIVPLADQFWGDRSGLIEDPFGHRWWLAQHTQDLTPEEIQKAAEEFFAQTANR
jgi:PhnB protein